MSQETNAVVSSIEFEYVESWNKSKEVGFFLNRYYEYAFGENLKYG